jgi:hypothetical protein
VEAPPDDAPGTQQSDIVVALARADMTLEDADATGLAQGRNLALAGEEIVQFGRAAPLDAVRWRLSDLRRGVRGTEWAMAGHVAGEPFALLDRDVGAMIDLPVASIGRSVQLIATGVGDTAGPVAATATVTGASVVPPAPVQLVATAMDDGSWRLDWTRRSRLGWAWSQAGAAGVGAPLVEERERYRVTQVAGTGVVEATEVDVPFLVRPTGPSAGTRIEVRQIGTYGVSRPALIIIGEPALG